MMLRLWPLICDFDLKFVESEFDTARCSSASGTARGKGGVSASESGCSVTRTESLAAMIMGYLGLMSVSVAGAQRKWHWPRQPPLVAPTRTCRAQWAAAMEVEVGGGDCQCGLKWNLKIMIFRLEISGCRGVCHWQTNLELVLGDLLLPTHHHEEIAGNFEFTLLHQGQLE